jgi:hypothetical protein
VKTQKNKGDVMTQPKIVAKSLKTILEDPGVQCILDRSCNLSDELINEVQGWWGYDLFNRKPSPAYDEYGVFSGTDLDLACFLYSLSGRGAVINIPTYKSHTQTKLREDQMVTSKANRHGEVLGVGANKIFFSFNVTIMDQNVVGEEKVGDFRTFSLTDKLGDWYDGWQRIEFVPTLKENRFITENKLWTGSKIIFKNFIHPNRWTSMFGRHYVITKMLIDRLEDECKFIQAEIKRIQAAGIEFPEGEGPIKYSYDYGKGVQKKFPAFETMIFIPDTEIKEDYDFYPTDQEGLVNAYNRRKRLLYGVIPSLRFMTRASEFAHYKHPDRFPAWMRGTKWEEDFTIPGKRIKWQRLKLFQPKVGTQSISILKRSFEKSATVSGD